MKTIKIVNTEPKDFTSAIQCAKNFIDKYIETNLGYINGAVYSMDNMPTFYVYQTKTQIVVRKV